MSTPKRALLLNDTSLAGNHGSQMAVAQLLGLARENGIEISDRRPLHVPLDGIDGGSLDLVIVNGEGSLHHSSKAARAIAAVPAWAASHSLPAFLVNSVYQQNDAKILEGVKGFAKVWTRDVLSFEALEADGLEAAGTCDLTLTIEPSAKLAEGRSLVLVTDSTLKKTNAELFGFSRRLKDSYYLPYRAEPPMPAGLAWDNSAALKRYRKRQRSSRLQLSSLARARYRNIIATPGELETFVAGNVSLMVCGRYHAVTLALTMGVPFVALPSNSFKVEALLDEADLKHRLIKGSIEKLSSEELSDNFIPYTDDEVKKIEALLTRHRGVAEEMFRTIAAECGTSDP